MHSRGSTEKHFYVRGVIKGGQWGHHIEKRASTPNSYTTPSAYRESYKAKGVKGIPLPYKHWGDVFLPPVCFLPVPFLFFSQFLPNVVTFPKI